MTHTIPDDPRGPAERAFRERMQPLLALADQHPDATELLIDGDDISLSFGDGGSASALPTSPASARARSRRQPLLPPSSPASSSAPTRRPGP